MRARIRSLLPSPPSPSAHCPRFGPGRNRGAVRHFDGRYSADTGQPDRGAGAYQFTRLYDLRSAGGLGNGRVGPPRKLVPGLATEWKSTTRTRPNGASPFRKGASSIRQRLQRRSVIWISTGRERQGAAIRQAPERAGEGPGCRRWRATPRSDDSTIEITTKTSTRSSLPDALFWSRAPRQYGKASQGLGQVRHPTFRHRAVQTDKTGGAELGRIVEEEDYWDKSGLPFVSRSPTS